MTQTSRIFVALGILSGFVFSAPAEAQRPFANQGRKDEVPGPLRAIFEGARKLRYSGKRTVVIKRGGVVESHDELVTKDGPGLRIEFGSGSKMAGQIIVENGTQRKHYLPDKNEIHVSMVKMDDAIGRLRRMTRDRKGGKFNFLTSDGGTIAGVKTQKIQFVDADKNTVLELFVDPRTGFLAKRVMYDKVGTVVGSFEFTQVDFNPRIGSDAFQLNRKGARIVMPIDELRSLAKANNLPLLRLGAKSGVLLEGSRISKTPDGVVLVQFYGAKEARVTLFITRHSIDDKVLKRMKPRDSNLYVWSENGVSLALVGEMTEQELRTMSGQLERF